MFERMESMHPDYYVKHMIPCDPESPFAFVSYASADKETVYRDVLEMQRRRFNLWIDNANLDKKKPSWTQDALKAVQSYNCRMILFYVSASSLTSQACYRELCAAVSDAARETHMGSIPIVVIEAEPVGTMAGFAASIRTRIGLSNLPEMKKAEMTRTLFLMVRNFLPLDNEKVRILPVSDTRLLSDYYRELERQLQDTDLPCRQTIYKLYRRGLDYYLSGDLVRAEFLLEQTCEHYAPSALLLGHLYLTSGFVTKARQMAADRLFLSAKRIVPSAIWKREADRMMKAKMYSEALAYYLGYGNCQKSGECFYAASKIFLQKGSRQGAINCLTLAAARGYNVDPRFVRLLHEAPAAEILKKAFTDEAAVH